MTSILRILLLAAVAALAACGTKIGDECNSSLDCAQDNTRICDISSPAGYCTVEGCDFGTCPEEAVCVRFFPGVQTTTPCASIEDCALDEICTVGGNCVPRLIERRFCMLRCEDNGDCRDGYECRNLELMKRHGGEPVPDPADETGTVPSTNFCGNRQPCTTNLDCQENEVCDPQTDTCAPL